MIQFSHPYMTTEKTIALTIRNFVRKVMSAFYMLSKIGTLSIIILFLWWIDDWSSRTGHFQSFNRLLIILAGPRAPWPEMRFAVKPRLLHKAGVMAVRQRHCDLCILVLPMACLSYLQEDTRCMVRLPLIPWVWITHVLLRNRLAYTWNVALLSW